MQDVHPGSSCCRLHIISIYSLPIFHKMIDLLRKVFSKSRSDKKRVLLTDIMFPSKYALWRISEITSFIKEKEADILVFKVDEFAGVDFDADYDLMCARQGFSDYNILIFDPKFNHLNKYNNKIDGARWNGVFPASYLFTRGEDFDLSCYDLIYHIFLMCYSRFNAAARFSFAKQAIHLYPGGGYLGSGSLSKLSRKTKVISTQPKTTLDLIGRGHYDFIECFGGTYIALDEPPIQPKALNRGVMSVAFASMGQAKEKGADYFEELVRLYKSSYPDQSVKFVSVGNLSFEEEVESHAPMAMHELMEFYRKEVDVIVSIDTAVAYNGWPLGVEAALNGVVLVTTDQHRLRSYYPFSDDAVHVFDLLQLEVLADFIDLLNKDREELLRRSRICQGELTAYYAHERQQARIFNYLEI